MEQTVKQTVKKATLRPRCIIERPRLIRALDASRSRLRMLIAPAGYGKTTLADQWTSMPERTAVWYPCRRSSADVAVLSVGIAEAASALLPGCVKRVRDRLHASRNPAEEIEVFADILAEDLAAWPSHAWLVIDDYHLAARLADAERFVELLVAKAPANVLLVSRQRPTWVSGRDILYGDVLELNQTELAMIHEEAAQLLSGDHAALTSGLVALANGWPAVVALASASQGVSHLSIEVPRSDAPPDALYEFFADEIYRVLDERVRRGMTILSLVPKLDWEIIVGMLGERDARMTVSRLTTVGILREQDTTYVVHPLAREFVENRVRPTLTGDLYDSLHAALTTYKQRKDWDSALELIDRADAPSELIGVMSEALDDLLQSGQLATIDLWLGAVARAGCVGPVVELAAAEAALRHGQLTVAETMAEGAFRKLNPTDELSFRCLQLAGRAAHIGSREHEALSFFRRARQVAASVEQKREAMWGELMAATALESDEAAELLRQLGKNLPVEDARERVRLADKELVMGLRFGRIPSLERSRQAAQLLPFVADPFVRCSFRSVFSFALTVSAHYKEGYSAASELIDDARESRVAFGLTYGHATAALALAGMRQFGDAHEQLDRALSAARRCADAYGEQNVYAHRMRVLLQEHRFAEARRLEPPDVSQALRGMRGEVMASRALAFACLGRPDAALALACEAAAGTRAIEPTVLALGVRAIVDVKTRGEQAIDSVGAFIEAAFSSGAVDLLATCYRASPDVLGVLLNSPSHAETVMFALSRSGDMALLEALGFVAEDVYDPVATLSQREREVYHMICEGMSNRIIARELFITEATVKAHAHHIFDKLGVRSRHALALIAAGKRSGSSRTVEGTDS